MALIVQLSKILGGHATRRIFVSDHDCDEIIRLRKSGAGWLKIETMTKVPRRTAKRIFEEQQQSESVEETKAARRQVAAELFALHMRDLLSIAAEISRNLKDPEPSDRRRGQEIMQGILASDNRSLGRGELSPLLADRDSETVERQNRILLDSLKVHSRTGVNWNVLDRWLEARDDWQMGSEKMEAEAGELIRGKVAGLTGRLVPFREPGMVDKMAKGVVEAVFRSLLAGKLVDAKTYITIRHIEKGSVITFGGDASRDFLLGDNEAAYVVVASCCRPAAEELTVGKKSSLGENLAQSLASMRKACGELADRLDELRLTPLILQTKCDICPA
jgi:hypothetical protein